MHRPMALFLLMFAGFASAAEDPLASVDPLFRKYVLSGPLGLQMEYLGALPESHAQFAVPGLAVVGVQLNDRYTTIVFKAPDGTDVVRATTDFLQREKWQAISTAQIGAAQQHGFVPYSAMPVEVEQPLQYCKETEGRLTLSAAPSDNVVMILVAPSSPCETNELAQHHLRSRAALPLLMLPKDTHYRSGGGGGGTRYQSSEVEFEFAGTLAEVQRHFSRLLSEQGWQSDGEWLGLVSAGNGWQHDDGRRLTLHLSRDDKTFLGQMLVWPVDGRGGSGRFSTGIIRSVGP